MRKSKNAFRARRYRSIRGFNDRFRKILLTKGGRVVIMWIIANWKSNKNVSEALEWVEVVGPKLPRNEKLKVIVCPQFVDILEVKKAVQVGNYPMMVGSQDLSPFDEGPFTGEESADSLEGFVTLSILGHSERRQNFNETDEMVEKKVEQAKVAGIIPLVCVQSEDTPIPDGCEVAAYEPIFAIGTGTPDTPQNANTVAQRIKQKNPQVKEVLYGGSVTAGNCVGFVTEENISGLLIGKASLQSQEFIKIVEECSQNLT